MQPLINPEEPKKPLSNAKLAANRENAQHSAGPKTDLGKQESSKNARKHCLLAVGVIPEVDGPNAQEEFERLEAELWAHYSHAAVASGARGDRGRTTGAGNDGRAVSAEVPQRLWKRDRDFGRHGAFYCHRAARLRHTTRRFRQLAPVARTTYVVVSID